MNSGVNNLQKCAVWIQDKKKLLVVVEREQKKIDGYSKFESTQSYLKLPIKFNFIKIHTKMLMGQSYQIYFPFS